MGRSRPALPLGAGAYPAFSRPRKSNAAAVWPHLCSRVGKRRAAVCASVVAALFLIVHRRRGHSPDIDFVEAVAFASPETQEDADTLRQCQPFRLGPGRDAEYTIAIAGGLPLTDDYRAELRGMNRTVGVDSLQGLQAGDPLTTWIIQAAQPNSSVLKAADAADWAIVDKARESLQSVLVIGGQTSAAALLERRLGSSPSIAHFPERSWYERNWLRLPVSGQTTTGHLATSLALQCKSPGAMVHLYGFPSHMTDEAQVLAGHMNAEAAILATWIRTGQKITVHETPQLTSTASGQ